MMTLALLAVAVLVLVALLVAGGALDRVRPARRVMVDRPVTRERIVERPVVRERVVERPVETERVIEDNPPRA
ncbi:MAG: hypothetical protein JJD92_04030 [Frankiaceae bacterium]|nr:hypothetical protein [Frankiaceae bacterium]